jgi:hypothetical protein
MNKNRNKSEITLAKKMFVVAQEMASLATSMIMHDIDDDKAWKKHGQELLGASNILKEWGEAITEKYEQ